MDTVKVDVQKLQLLNDRISQTIEALNQVRMSMHGIHHSPYGAFTQSFGYPSPYGVQGYPVQQQGYPVQQQGYPVQYSPFVGSPFVPGIQHSSYAPQFSPWGMQAAPWATQSTPWATQSTPWTNGISHTTTDTPPMWQSWFGRTTMPWNWGC